MVTRYLESDRAIGTEKEVQDEMEGLEGIVMIVRRIEGDGEGEGEGERLRRWKWRDLKVVGLWEEV